MTEDHREKFFFPVEETKDWKEFDIKCLSCLKNSVTYNRPPFYYGKYIVSEKPGFVHRIIAYCYNCGAIYCDKESILRQEFFNNE